MRACPAWHRFRDPDLVIWAWKAQAYNLSKWVRGSTSKGPSGDTGGFPSTTEVAYGMLGPNRGTISSGFLAALVKANLLQTRSSPWPGTVAVALEPRVFPVVQGEAAIIENIAQDGPTRVLCQSLDDGLTVCLCCFRTIPSCC